MNVVMRVMGWEAIGWRVRAFILTLPFWFLLGGSSQAQSMFRGDPAHSGVYAREAPRQFHRVK
jgi:hypothetical protein